MESYEEYKHTIVEKSNTIDANETRKDCWQKIANRVNWYGNIYFTTQCTLNASRLT